MRPRRDSVESLRMIRYSRCSSRSDVSSRSSAIPITAFIGVRISWLMLARKSLLARLAASAASLAARSSSATRFCSVTSRAIAYTRPSWGTGVEFQESQRKDPSLQRKRFSKETLPVPAATAAASREVVSASSGCTNSAYGRDMSSAVV